MPTVPRQVTLFTYFCLISASPDLEFMISIEKELLSPSVEQVNSSPRTAWGRVLPTLTERAGHTLTRSFDAVYTTCQGYTGHSPAQTSLDKYEIQ